jgi:hypothetical protein
MQKKGQITIIIIIGIIILAAVSTMIFFKNQSFKEGIIASKEEITQTDFNVAGIKSYVESCITKTTNEAILENGRSGGYFYLPNESTKDLFENVPYYSTATEDLFPTNEIIANELSYYLDTMLDLCLENFAPYVKQGFNVTMNEPSSKIKLTMTKIRVNTNLPLTIKKGTGKKELAEFSVEIPAKSLVNDLIVAKEIVKGQEAGEICVTCFSALALKNNLEIQVLPLDNNTYFFEMVDNDYFVNRENYKLNFAVQYNEKIIKD